MLPAVVQSRKRFRTLAALECLGQMCLHVRVKVVGAVRRVAAPHTLSEPGEMRRRIMPLENLRLVGRLKPTSRARVRQCLPLRRRA